MIPREYNRSLRVYCKKDGLLRIYRAALEFNIREAQIHASDPALPSWFQQRMALVQALPVNSHVEGIGLHDWKFLRLWLSYDELAELHAILTEAGAMTTGSNNIIPHSGGQR